MQIRKENYVLNICKDIEFSNAIIVSRTVFYIITEAKKRFFTVLSDSKHMVRTSDSEHLKSTT